MGLAEQDPSMKLLSPAFTQEPYGIGIAKGTIIERAYASTKVLLMGYGLGLALAMLLRKSC